MIDNYFLVGFTGIDSAYECPQNPDLVLKAGEITIEECVERVVSMLRDRVCSLDASIGIITIVNIIINRASFLLLL